MNELIKYFTNSLASKSLSLKKKGVLIEKPWVLIGDNNIPEKLIFKRNNELIISKNGKVKMATWEYFPDAQALLIDRDDDKILLKEQFIDTNVLVLNVDNTEDYYILANENEIPDLNIPQYLNSLKIQEFSIKEIPLHNGGVIQIHQAPKTNYLEDFAGKTVEIRDDNYNSFNIPDDYYLTKNRKYTLCIENDRIISFKENYLIESDEDQYFEIINGHSDLILENLNKRVTSNGNIVPDGRFNDGFRHIFEVKNGIVDKILFVCYRELKDGSPIIIEFKFPTSVSLENKG
jgi:hypothetical protein